MTAVLVKLNRLQYEFRSFCNGEAEDSVLLDYDIASFWNSILLSFSGVFKMKALCSFLTSGSDYTGTQHHIPDQQNPLG